jgi:surface antigen
LNEAAEVAAMRRAIAAVGLSLALVACEGGGGIGGMGQKQTVGALGGAALGGLAGSAIGSGSGQLLAVGAGALIGGLLGSQVGKSLDAKDRQHAEGAFERASAAPVGETVSWRNPDSGAYGTVTPVRESRASDGRPCREYRTTIYVDGRSEEGTGVACRNADGSWQIVS